MPVLNGLYFVLSQTLLHIAALYCTDSLTLSTRPAVYQPSSLGVTYGLGAGHWDTGPGPGPGPDYTPPHPTWHSRRLGSGSRSSSSPSASPSPSPSCR
ncbi:uncharacterized protein RAG0_16979 [Rhynchosporium agropyri]|uniref:Uncharacterized protein n=1 Tax=Rhynchosporium agropyri TaxID=914238 RepID=A0A1E1LSJ9_9HELO|nr:uncharacterized protein RAG0_16979 [Rhynchosporium agropyri]